MTTRETSNKNECGQEVVFRRLHAFFLWGGGEKLSSDDQGMHRLFPFRNSPLKLRIGFQIEREIPTLEELGQETV